MSVALDSNALAADTIDFIGGCAGLIPISVLARLYRGPFLEGFEYSTPEFEHWVGQERHRLGLLAERSVVAASMADISRQMPRPPRRWDVGSWRRTKDWNLFIVP